MRPVRIPLGGGHTGGNGHARSPAFARDPATAAYYEQRAQEYDQWYLGSGSFANWQRPGWGQALDQGVGLVRRLGAAHLAGELGGQVLLDGTWFVAARVT